MKKKVPSRIIFVVWPFIVVGCFLLVCIGECWKEVFSFSASFAELQLMTSSFDQYGNFSVSSINQMKFVDSLDFSNSLKSLLWSVHTELTKWRLWISSTQLLRRLRWSITIQILSIGWVRYQSYQPIERSLMLFQQIFAGVLGGNLGLFLGASMVSAVEVFVFLVGCCRSIIRR